jgi:hypothetical protein
MMRTTTLFLVLAMRMEVALAPKVSRSAVLMKLIQAIVQLFVVAIMKRPAMAMMGMLKVVQQLQMAVALVLKESRSVAAMASTGQGIVLPCAVMTFIPRRHVIMTQVLQFLVHLMKKVDAPALKVNRNVEKTIHTFLDTALPLQCAVII